MPLLLLYVSMTCTETALLILYELLFWQVILSGILICKFVTIPLKLDWTFCVRKQVITWAKLHWM